MNRSELIHRGWHERSIYATDASMYREVPSGIATPRDGEELRHIVVESATRNEPILARGAGTSLAGQTVEYHCSVGNHCGFGMVAYLIVGDVNEPCPGDVNGDQAVTFNDLLEILASWGSDDAAKDVDGSGTVDFGDVLGTLANWGPC